MLRLVKATQEHSAPLQKFYQQQTLAGHLNYGLFRPNSFFDKYSLVSDDHHTAVLMDNEDNILGAASIAFKKTFIDRQEQVAGFLSDLRVASQRHAIKSWAEFLVPDLYRQMEERQCKYVFSAMEQFENQAFNALLRPQKRRRHLPRYYLFRHLRLVFYLGYWPWQLKTESSINVQYAGPNDVEEIADYLLSKRVGSRLYHRISAEILRERFKTWPQFSINNFLVARRYDGTIIGCMAPWNNKEVQQLEVKSYTPSMEILQKTLGVAQLTGFAKPLPKEDTLASVKMITHCAVDHSEVFLALMIRAYKDSDKHELLVHTNYNGDYYTRPPGAFITTKIPYGFYSVLPPKEDLPSFLQPNPFTPPPDFGLEFF